MGTSGCWWKSGGIEETLLRPRACRVWQRYFRIRYFVPVCKNVMICQRRASGRCAKEGMPRCRDPFVNTQNRAPGAALDTPACVRGGALSSPWRLEPWQEAHSREYNLAPARFAFSSPSNRFCLLAAFAGACDRRSPPFATATVARKQTSPSAFICYLPGTTFVLHVQIEPLHKKRRIAKDIQCYCR